MKIFVAVLCPVLTILAVVSQPSVSASIGSVTEIENVFETRCGWFSNPTPSNAWLTDRHGEWLISVQGGYQAEGDWPAFKDSQWVKTNINYGYGCACMKVTTSRAEMKIVSIQSAFAKPISACRRDRALKRKEPK